MYSKVNFATREAHPASYTCWDSLLSLCSSGATLGHSKVCRNCIQALVQYYLILISYFIVCINIVIKVYKSHMFWFALWFSVGCTVRPVCGVSFYRFAVFPISVTVKFFSHTRLFPSKCFHSDHTRARNLPLLHMPCQPLRARLMTSV